MILDGRAEDLVEADLADGTFPCCAISLGFQPEARERKYFGSPDPETSSEPLTPGALFDLASLTKPLATTILALIALERGLFRLGDPALAFLPGTPALGNGATIGDLLLHTSGLPAVPSLEKHFPDSSAIDREKAIYHLKNIEPASGPGLHVDYSCTGFLLLGLILEKLGQARLAALFRREIALPLGLEGGKPAAGRALFMPGQQDRTNCVPTEFCSWRLRRMRGEVHDESSFCLGGDGGNAGLFADLAGTETLFGLYIDGGGLLSESTVLEARTCRTEGMEQRRGLGLLLSPPASGWSNSTYGHTGFVGNSAWMDPENRLSAIILSNRVYYGRTKTLAKIQAFRTDFHGWLAGQPGPA